MADLSDEGVTVSPQFIQQVRDLLEHLYDFPYLQKQTLVLLSPQTGRAWVEAPGQKARKLVLEALEHIGEEKSLSFRSAQARIYNLLRLHYIEGMAIQEVAQELGLSQRQTYRDLRHGDERIAALVLESLVKQQPVPAQEAPAQAAPETRRLQVEPQLQPTNLSELVSAVCSTVQPLAALRSVEVDLHLPQEPVIVPTDAMIARQVITGLLSLALQESSHSPLTVRLIPGADGCSLQLLFQSVGDPARKLDPSIGLYAQNLGWTISRQAEAGQVGLVVKIPHPRSHLPGH
jgi:signal transduction histidine kinase